MRGAIAVPDCLPGLICRVYGVPLRSHNPVPQMTAKRVMQAKRAMVTNADTPLSPASKPLTLSRQHVPTGHDIGQTANGFTLVGHCERNTRLAAYRCERGHESLHAPYKVAKGMARCYACMREDAHAKPTGKAHT